MIVDIERFTKLLLEKVKNKKVHVVSHHDTDGITSAAIMIKTLERLSKQFSVKILKQLSEEDIDMFPKDNLTLLLDLGSSHLEELSNKNVVIIDHHEIKKMKRVNMLNPHLLKDSEDLCSAELCYLVSKQINEGIRI